jgi:hypothetical protein
MEGRHTDFSIMDFYADKAVEKRCDPVRRTLDLATVQPRRVLPNETAEFAPVRIVVHEGDWHATADAHREWLETWVTKPDRPDRFAKSIGWHFFFMKHQDGWERQAYDDLPQLADAALEAGCDYLLLFGWQEGGHDNNYMYRYVPNEAWGGAEALRLAIAECRERGVEIMPFYNGTLANIELEEHKAFGHRWEAKTRAGHPYYAGDWARHNYDAPTRNRAMLHHEIAPCAEHRAYFLETMRRMIEEYGFGNTQLDQIAEKMFVDYCEDHIETRPDRVFVDGLAAILSDVRRMIRAQNPEGVMISESLNDFTGQWCDSSWDWNILLPFPEPILYSLPWLMASHEIDADEYAESNTAFAYKMHFDMKIDGGDSPITRYPEFAAHVRALSVLRKATANYVALARFRDEENLHISDAPPNVVAKSYHDPQQNRAGVVLAETSGIAARVRLKIAWRSADDAVPVLSSAGTREMVELEGAEGRCLLTLAPYEVKIVCIDLL